MAIDHITIFRETKAISIPTQLLQSQVPKMTMATTKPLHKSECDRRNVSMETDSRFQQLQIL